MYSDRICAYIDILGFRELVAQLGGDEEKAERLKDILDRVHRVGVTDVPNLTETVDYRTQSISDAVAISVRPTISGLFLIFRAVEILSMELLALGYLIRGAIVKGPLHHDDTVIFGDALIKAYDLETAVVRFPRVMVTSPVLALLEVSEPTGRTAKLIEACKSYIRDSSDGPRFLHVLRKFEADLSTTIKDKETIQKYADLQEQIERRFDSARDTPAHFDKVRWFADYWNSIVAPTAYAFQIHKPGLKPLGLFFGGPAKTRS